jgi:O-antigen biosynthesis protein
MADRLEFHSERRAVKKIRGRGAGFPLTPAQDARGRDFTFVALSDTPWLEVDIDAAALAGRWIKITYAAGLFDRVSRPFIRFWTETEDGFQDEIMPGPLLGRAIWAGRVPRKTTKIWISPTDRPGAFSFRLEKISVLSTAGVILSSIRRNPTRFVVGLSARFVRLGEAAYKEFRGALCVTELDKYQEWSAARLRSIELTGLDSPRTDWNIAPKVHFVTRLAPGAIPEFLGLIQQLRDQPYPNWSLTALCPNEALPALSSQLDLVDSSSVRLLSQDAEFGLFQASSNSDLISPIEIGDEIPPYALACLGEEAASRPDVEIFYGDQEIVSPIGDRSIRALPDWSPILCSNISFMHGSDSIRVGMLETSVDARSALTNVLSADFISRIALHRRCKVEHIRRVLRGRRSTSRDCVRPDTVAAAAPRISTRNSPTRNPKSLASIVIPSRDRKLLSACVTSLAATTAPESLEILVVNNAPVSDLGEIPNEKAFANFQILHRPGPFNFSNMCNEAAKVATGSALVFLNDDTEAVSPDWLAPMIDAAAQPGIGAVGAKLLYPNSRVQHAGVVLGLRGLCGHFEQKLGRDDPGYFGRLCFAHEVSAVTGACLVVEKRKFDDINGFDEINLPIDLNDIDLCLRLSERGWNALLLPQSVLVHHESLSRGRKIRVEEIYSAERSYFRRRWISRLRDDPFFHPTLSLDTSHAALG